MEPQGKPMKALRRVLVATHGPIQQSRFALERAAGLPLEQNADLILLHVADGVRTPEVPINALVLKGAEIMGAAGRPDVRVRGILREGRLAREVARVADLIRAELVVLVRGERPASPFGRIKDRIARSPLRGVAAPILVVWPRPMQKYKHPIISVDLHPVSARALVQETFRLCPEAQVLTVLHVADTSFGLVLRVTGSSCSDVVDFRRQTERRAGSELRRVLTAVCEVPLPSGVRIEQTILSGSPTGSILAEVDRLDSELVVVGRTPASHLFQRILAEAPCDVLVVPIEELERRRHPREGLSWPGFAAEFSRSRPPRTPGSPASSR